MQPPSFVQRTKVAALSIVLVLVAGLAIGITTLVASATPAAQPTEAPAENAPVEKVIDGECSLVGSDGLPLYDSQFAERTGSSPCEQN